ncbi:phage terminase large subunit [Delftia sp. DLF01]|jgi:phage terminase large subunit|uniref:phage terminase large subunit n=1 Tax=Delftia sp. DLF01 TaxID=2769279 RepID=UPI0021F0A0A6|nr:phage terminase large subunit [Delftia sp. DLF01]
MNLLSASMQAAHLAGEGPEPDFAEDYEVDRSRVRVEFPAKLRGLFQPKHFKVTYGGRGGAESWSVAMALLVMGSNRPLRILCAREIQKSMRDSVHRLLSDQIAALDLRKFRRSVQASDAPNKRDQVKGINQEIEVSMHLLNEEVHLKLEKAKTQRP